jgi:GMP synthase-like glutamine amidotransferase
VEFLGDAVAESIPVLGICFGSQALATALGSEISTADPVEVGWLEIRTSEPWLVSPGPWLHFNSERFTLPSEATLVASLGAGASAFRVGANLGLQFHPEATPILAGRWADHFADWLSGHGLSATENRHQAVIQSAAAAPRAFALFDAWWACVRGPA